MSRLNANILFMSAIGLIVYLIFFMPSENKAMTKCQEIYSKGVCVKMVYGG